MSAPEVVQTRREDCEVARTPEELIAWIESVHAQFDQTRNYAWMEKGLLKPFYEEIVPLGDLARHKYLGRPGLYLRPKIGNQSYDAEIIDTSSGNEHMKRVEFTSTYRDSDHALRMEYLAQNGGVFMSGAVWRDGTKASGGQIHVVPGCEDYESRFDDLVPIIEERVAKKLDRPYAAGTIIAIVFDDYRHRSKTHVPQLQTYLRDTLSKQALDKFCGVCILGASGKTFLEFDGTLLSWYTKNGQPRWRPLHYWDDQNEEESATKTEPAS
jgi:hypothetical protein